MIVDCHTHIDFSAENAGVSEHLSASETVDHCIVLAGPGESGSQENTRLSDYVNSHKGKMTGFAFLDPASDPVGPKKVRSVTEKLGLKGIVLYCCASGFHPAHSKAMCLYEAVLELDLPVFFHNGSPLGSEAVLEYAQPYLLDEVARTFPGLKMIIGDMGTPFTEQTLSMISMHENVYADLTVRHGRVWGVYNMVVSAYERGVLDKMLFGSGFPAGISGECIETLLGFNKLLGDTSLPTVPRGEIREIVERDTLELLGISK
ncbi:MAG: amidohydrolase family protein [Planctomycetota bacterium]|jgi:predicted TIM-barrel fold metal-dependent hydrolase